MATWYSIDPNGAGEETDRLTDAWMDAPTDNVEVCTLILETAQDQVIAYAPANDITAGGEPLKDRLVYAQLQQAINLFNAGNVGGSGTDGAGEWTFVPRPLDKTIRGIIRPVSGYSHAL